MPRGLVDWIRLLDTQSHTVSNWSSILKSPIRRERHDLDHLIKQFLPNAKRVDHPSLQEKKSVE